MTPLDIPPLEIFFAAHDDSDGSFGAKSAGEVALAPIAPAIVDGVHQAVGVWVTDLPITPERLWQALNKESLKTVL
jgi:CO/xanthine dehydrogenase Mo-binding subunit